MINKLVGGLFGKIVDNAEGILDKVITTDKEREQAKIELKRVLVSVNAWIIAWRDLYQRLTNANFYAVIATK